MGAPAVVAPLAPAERAELAVPVVPLPELVTEAIGTVVEAVAPLIVMEDAPAVMVTGPYGTCEPERVVVRVEFNDRPVQTA